MVQKPAGQFRTAAAIAILILPLVATTGRTFAAACVPQEIVAWYLAEGNTSESVAGHDGVSHGGTTFAPGAVGQAFNFNGTDAYVEVPDTSFFDPTTSGSESAWVNFKTLPSASHIMQIIGKGSNSQDCDLQANTDDRFHFYIQAGYHVDSTTVITTGTWYHVTGTWDSTVGLRIYVNGVLEGSYDGNVTRFPSGQPLEIGSQPSFSGRYFHGQIDEVKLFNRAITADEVAYMYNFDTSFNCNPYIQSLNELYTTGTSGWTQFGSTNANQNTQYDGTNKALTANISASDSGYRIIGWLSPASDTMYYSSVGTAQYVRAKYYIYSNSQTGGALNQIPNFRIRVANRFAVSAILQVYNHLDADPEATDLSQDIRPSSNPASPSVYRVDLDPIDVPQLTSNPTTEGFLRLFEAYEPDPQANGATGMTECRLGVYPARPDFATTVPVTQNGLIKSYRTGPTDGGDFGDGSTTSSNSAITIAKYFNGAVETTGPLPTVTIGSAGVTLETLSVQSDRFSAAGLDVFNDTGDQTNHLTRARVEPYKQYKIRFHATSTRQTNTQAVMRFRARTIKFQYTAALELGGSHAASVANNTIAAQVQPGIGNQMPASDRINPSENGGWYNVLMASPMNYEIQLSQPNLNAQDGPGVDTAPSNNSKSRRDLQFGFDVIDTFTTQAGAELESGQMTVDRVDIEKYDLVQD